MAATGEASSPAMQFHNFSTNDLLSREHNNNNNNNQDLKL
ncbi:hypothetical protein CASFOL_017916 [Castilleja foliolosa]|uniref:Uncharacterized protein n=1 Tax=Castilleja foliolosa TaxID=1961234 RepID=A0ABD3DCD8_9LAMI